MNRAPAASFRKARALYLNKYPLPQDDEQASLKLFVCDEQLTETVETVEGADPQQRKVTLRSSPGALAIVHWQQTAAPAEDLVRQYLQQSWGLDSDAMTLEVCSEPWFRNGGHQTRIAPPEGLAIQQQSVLSLGE